MAKQRAVDLKKKLEVKEWTLQEQRVREQTLYMHTHELAAAQHGEEESLTLAISGCKAANSQCVVTVCGNAGSAGSEFKRGSCAVE